MKTEGNVELAEKAGPGYRAAVATLNAMVTQQGKLTRLMARLRIVGAVGTDKERRGVINEVREALDLPALPQPELAAADFEGIVGAPDLGPELAEEGSLPDAAGGPSTEPNARAQVKAQLTAEASAPDAAVAEPTGPPPTIRADLPQGDGKKMVAATAEQFLDAADGDKDKAKELAKANGWKL